MPCSCPAPTPEEALQILTDGLAAAAEHGSPRGFAIELGATLSALGARGVFPEHYGDRANYQLGNLCRAAGLGWLYDGDDFNDT